MTKGMHNSAFSPRVSRVYMIIYLPHGTLGWLLILCLMWYWNYVQSLWSSALNCWESSFWKGVHISWVIIIVDYLHMFNCTDASNNKPSVCTLVGNCYNSFCVWHLGHLKLCSVLYKDQRSACAIVWHTILVCTAIGLHPCSPALPPPATVQPIGLEHGVAYMHVVRWLTWSSL